MNSPDALPPLPPTTVVTPATWTAALALGDMFPEPRPLEVDVGCGKGRFLLARAGKHPGLNFLGIERLLVRVRKIDRKAVRAGLANVRLLRLEAAYTVEYLLPPACVTTYYILFPDPWPKRRHHRRRLFTPAFIDSLERTLVPGGCVHAATDHAEYFAQIRQLLAADARFEAAPTFVPEADERTDFELEFLSQGLEIGRCSFRKRQSAASAAPPPPSP